MDNDSLAEAITSTRVVSYVTAGCITLLTFDTFLTICSETELIWQGKWTMTKILYILTRYSAFAEAGVLVYQLSIPGEWYNRCSLAFKINIFLFLFGLGFGEVIMTIRTWAVWGQNRALMFLLPAFFLGIWGGALVSVILFLQDIKFDPHPITSYVGCYATHTGSIIFFSWVLLLVYDAVMFVLMAIPAYKAFRDGGSSNLMVVVYRDGILYYFYLFSLSLVNIVVTLTLSSSLMLMFSLLSRIMHSLLACRVVLDIHEIGRQVLVHSPGQRRIPVHTRSTEVFTYKQVVVA